jgi:hypothetical protein
MVAYQLYRAIDEPDTVQHPILYGRVVRLDVASNQIAIKFARRRGSANLFIGVTDVYSLDAWLRDGHWWMPARGTGDISEAEVQAVLGSRRTPSGLEFLVRWKHDASTEWVKDGEIDAPELVDEWRVRAAAV